MTDKITLELTLDELKLIDKYVELNDETESVFDKIKYAYSKPMTKRNFTKELLYSYYADMENGDDIESIDYRSLIHIITEFCDRIEQLEKDNELLKSYAWEQ